MARRKRTINDNNKVKREPEKVLTISNDIVDPLLNPPEEKESEFTYQEKVPDWVANAINSNEPLQITNDENLVGKLVDVPLHPEASEITNPVQASMDNLNASRLEKKILFEKGQFQRDSLAIEKEKFLQRRLARAIPVPNLPSKFSPYPEEIRVSYFPYNAQELEDMNNPEIPTYEKYLVALEGIKTEGITPADLTFSDFLYIGDARHLQAMGDNVSFRYPYFCKHCMCPGVFNFKLNKVSFAELEVKLPLRVRFYSFPDDEFQFLPHTIGDVITLMKTDKYWRKIGEEYITNSDDERIINDMAINASRCISHSWEDAYLKFLEASENPKDRMIFSSIEKALYHGTEPIKFRCIIPTDKKLQSEMAQEAAKLMNGISVGDISTITPNDESKNELPPWMQVHIAGENNNNNNTAPEKIVIKRCGAENQIDILAGDVIIPFCRNDNDMEYGILGI